MKSLGTYKGRAWGMVSTRVTNFLLETCLLSDALADVYELEPLDGSDYWYTEPEKGDTDGLKCGCNTIIYRSVFLSICSRTSDDNHILPFSLYSACTACQNASTLAWAQWNKNCDAVYVTQ